MDSTLYFDGSSKPHVGGPASYGFVLENGICVVEETAEVPEELGNTSNVAEYYALIKGLEKAIQRGISELTIIGDSQLIIYQVTGRYRCKKKHLQPLLERVHELLELMPSYDIQWVRRAENKADEFSRV